MHAAFCLATFLGHLALWVALFNRLHSLGIPDRIKEQIEKLVLAGLVAGPGLAVWAVHRRPELLYQPWEWVRGAPAVAVYAGGCVAMGMWVVLRWTQRRVRGRSPDLVSQRREIARLDRQLRELPCSDWPTRFWARVPGNQILQVEVATKTLRIARLPAALDGLRIAHLSDLHFSGRITAEFFAWIVERTNRLRPDVVAITGDLIDHRRCLPWIPEILGRLQSPGGTFCILGNHEVRLENKSLILDMLHQAGLHYLGGGCRTIEVAGQTIFLAGNELPWWSPAADVASGLEKLPAPPTLRLLLAHTPDRIHWARQRDFDLMLAGHTHGGQICFPFVGPVVTQSRYGVSFCSGVYSQPPTVLHVSRGVSGCQPLRWNCRPELALLILESVPEHLPRPPHSGRLVQQLTTGGG